MNSSSVLNLVLFLPLIGAAVLSIMPREQHTWFKYGAFGIALANFALSLTLLGDLHPASGAYDFVTDVAWIPQFSIHYKIGADGISLAMVLLTTLLSAIAILSAFDAV